MIDEKRRLTARTSPGVKGLDLFVYLFPKLALGRRRASDLGSVLPVGEDRESRQVVLVRRVRGRRIVGPVEDAECEVDPAPPLHDKETRVWGCIGSVEEEAALLEDVKRSLAYLPPEGLPMPQYIEDFWSRRLQKIVSQGLIPWFCPTIRKTKRLLFRRRRIEQGGGGADERMKEGWSL